MAHRTYSTDSELDMLMKQFPEIDRDTIVSIFEEFRQDIYKTTKALFEMSERNPSSWSPEENRIINSIRHGYKVMVLMRGLPGSGKTSLANRVFEASDIELPPAKFILSTDDYFCSNGRYEYNVNKLEEAHKWNQERCFKFARKGFSPLIIDNTNLAKWEMRPYCAMAVNFGYIIEFLEPNTPWSQDPHVLARKSVHNVPKDKIMHMLKHFERDLNPRNVLIEFGMKYSLDLPQFRQYPSLGQNSNQNSYSNLYRSLSGSNVGVSKSESMKKKDEPLMECVYSFDENKKKKEEPSMEYVYSFDDIKKKKGAGHAEEKKEGAVSGNENLNEPKTFNQKSGTTSPLPNQNSNPSEPEEPLPDPRPTSDIGNLIDFLTAPSNSVSTEDTLSRCAASFPLMPMQAPMSPKPEEPMKSDSSTASSAAGSHLSAWGTNERALQSWETVVPVKSSLSAMDVEIFKKIDTASNRIKTQVSDKTTNTLSEDFKFAQNCPEADGASIIKAQNRAINAAADITITSSREPKRKITIDTGCMTEDRVPEEVDDPIRQLKDVFPHIPVEDMLDVYEKCQGDLNWTMNLLSETEYEPELSTAKNNNGYRKRINERKPVVINSWEKYEEFKPKNDEGKIKSQQDLKKKIEESIRIGEEHYSEHVWGLKTQRQSGFNSKQNSVDSDTQTEDNFYNSDENESEETIQISLGSELVKQLEKAYGDKEFFDQKFHTSVQMPVSLAKQLHALYLQSICVQIEEQTELIEKDKEYAEKLNYEAREGDKTPNLNAIMDEQLAELVHNKDLDKFRAMSVDTFASILKKSKLYRAFPSVTRQVIDASLSNYEYDYDRCFEMICASVNPKFVASEEGLKDNPIGDDIVKDMKDHKAFIENASDQDDSTATPGDYREHARLLNERAQHLDAAARLYHSRRGWGEVALFYAALAADARRGRDVANQRAAIALLRSRATTSRAATLDLHHLTVREAVASLDLFVDVRARKLADAGGEGREEAFVVTGRGKHNPSGRSRIKPPVAARLRKRGIRYIEMNPGLLKIKLHKDLKMSKDIE